MLQNKRAEAVLEHRPGPNHNPTFAGGAAMTDQELTTKKQELLTQERLREIMNYSPDSGVFTWKERKKGRRFHKAVGSPNAGGYLCVLIDYKSYRLNRLAWFYMTGQWPQEEVDHKNGDRIDNRWKNLREASRLMNLENQRKARSDNSCGKLGVSKRRGNRVKPWQATIQTCKRQIHLGYFATSEEAHQAYIKAKRQVHQGCTL
jgi:hypothetical protein